MPTHDKDRPQHRTLWQQWDKVMDNSHNPVAREYHRKSAENRTIDQAVHKTPVSRKQIERLKAQRLIPRAQSVLTPTGPMQTHVLTSQEVIRERQIGFQERRLGRVDGEAQRAFGRSQGRFSGPRRSGPSR